VMWSHDPEDWNPHHPETLTDRVARCFVPRAIVLLHDGTDRFPDQGRATTAALIGSLRQLEGLGLRATTVSREPPTSQGDPVALGPGSE
jgi:hypothetical protein